MMKYGEILKMYFLNVPRITYSFYILFDATIRCLIVELQQQRIQFVSWNQIQFSLHTKSSLHTNSNTTSVEYLHKPDRLVLRYNIDVQQKNLNKK